MRAAPRRIIATATGSGVRQATPSTNVSAVSVLTTSPCVKEREYAGAFSATTPTISVRSPSRSRTTMLAQIPLPIPTGT